MASFKYTYTPEQLSPPMVLPTRETHVNNSSCCLSRTAPIQSRWCYTHMISIAGSNRSGWPQRWKVRIETPVIWRHARSTHGIKLNQSNAKGRTGRTSCLSCMHSKGGIALGRCLNPVVHYLAKHERYFGDLRAFNRALLNSLWRGKLQGQGRPGSQVTSDPRLQLSDTVTFLWPSFDLSRAMAMSCTASIQWHELIDIECTFICIECTFISEDL